MDPLGDLDNGYGKDSRKFNLSVGCSDVATQQIDRQSPPGDDFRDEAYDFHYRTDTMTANDNFFSEDSFQTQLADHAGETQPIDLFRETQPIDLFRETQPIDLFRETQLMDLEWSTQLLHIAGETQVLDDVDCVMDVSTNSCSLHNVDITQATDEVEGITDTQILSQNSLDADDRHQVTLGNGSETCSGNERDSVSRTPSDTFHSEDHHSGSVFGGFTSIRTASMRASGLAARLRGASSCGNEKPSLKHMGVEQLDTIIVGDFSKFDSTNHEDCRFTKGREKTHNPNQFKANTKRKLFTEERVSKACLSKADINHTNKHPHLDGLSNVNSEEPGELSQVMALEAVDRFLEYNVMEYGPDLDCGILYPKESNAASAIGSRDLAKSSILKSKDGESRAYDWDDSCEDEGGGDFFQKKREVFFVQESSKAKFFTEPRKFGGADRWSYKTNTYHKTGKKKAYTEKKLGDPEFLDSGIILHKMGAKKRSLRCEEDTFLNNPSKDLFNPSNKAPVQKLPEDNISNDIPDINVIGPDTQIAVEAMETLCYEAHMSNTNDNGSEEGDKKVTTSGRKNQSTVGIVTRSSSLKHTGSLNKQQTAKWGKVAQRKQKDDVLLGRQSLNILSRKVKENKDGSYWEKSLYDIEPCHGMELNGQKFETKQFLVDQLNFSVPVAHRTRKYTKLSCSKSVGNVIDTGKEMHDIPRACVLGRETAIHDKSAEIHTTKKFRKVKSIGVKKSNKNSAGTSIDTLECVTLKRIHGKVLLDKQTGEMQCNTRSKRSRNVSANTSLYPGRSHANHSTDSNCIGFSSNSEKILLDETTENGSSKAGKSLSHLTVDNESSKDDNEHGSDYGKVNEIAHDAQKASTPPQCDGISDMMTLSSAEAVESIGKLDALPSGRRGTSILNCTTPNCATSKNDVSPICMGNEYYKLSCRKNLPRFSLTKEVDSLINNTSVQFGGTIELRRRKDNTNIRVLFSQHLDLDVVKQQKKILSRFGTSAASSMLDATHFVADEFVRTRNMLEAIAFGRPVVTHLWLESCGQTNCLVNEKNYILRDARKEKEFGFCMPVSLSRACQRPLLLGQKILVTQNTKPGKDTITNLIKAVHGLAVERLGRSSLNYEKLSEDLLILSCEEDYDVCVPFLEKGCAVYSSELLLNGIVRQKLEFERYRLFTDQVRKTRSTIWVKKRQGLQPTKCK